MPPPKPYKCPRPGCRARKAPSEGYCTFHASLNSWHTKARQRTKSFRLMWPVVSDGLTREETWQLKQASRDLAWLYLMDERPWQAQSGAILSRTHDPLSWEHSCTVCGGYEPHGLVHRYWHTGLSTCGQSVSVCAPAYLPGPVADALAELAYTLHPA